MAVIKYLVKENNAVGTHSFYAVPQSYSTLTCDDMASEIVEGLGISPELVPTIIKRYMRVVIRNVQRGHRVKLGDELVVYPQISCSVKDEVDQDGNVLKAATADMLNVATARSTIGATVAQAVQQQFAQSVSWKRVNLSTDGEAVEGTGSSPDGETTEGPANQGGSGSSHNGETGGGSGDPDDGDGME